jgi:phosphoribosylglycinamide formyltransferase 1
MTFRFGWFTTARGPGSRGMYEAVASAIAEGRLDAEFAFVFANRDRGESPLTDSFFDLVEAHGHPLVTRSSVAFRRAVGGRRSEPGAPLPSWRLEYDQIVEEAVAEHPFEIGVLAGYMLIFEREFVSKHPLLNLHPALPTGPIGTWREVIRDLIRMGAEESGVMLHLAIPEVDAGPVVAYCRYPLHDSELQPLWNEMDERIESLSNDELEATALFHAIRDRGVRYEAPLLVATLGEFASGRLRVDGTRILNASGDTAEPQDLTASVALNVAMAAH